MLTLVLCQLSVFARAEEPNAESNEGGASGIIRGPYLQQGTASSMILRWRTAEPSGSVVKYGTLSDELSETAENKTVTTDHEVLISGLKPKVKYYYAVGNSEGMLSVLSKDSSIPWASEDERS